MPIFPVAVYRAICLTASLRSRSLHYAKLSESAVLGWGVGWDWGKGGFLARSFWKAHEAEDWQEKITQKGSCVAIMGKENLPALALQHHRFTWALSTVARRTAPLAWVQLNQRCREMLVQKGRLLLTATLGWGCPG